MNGQKKLIRTRKNVLGLIKNLPMKLRSGWANFGAFVVHAVHGISS